MKKIKLFILSAGVIFPLASCGGNSEKQHTEHTWNSGEITKPATCVETGIKTYTCAECGQTKTETIEKTGHSYGDWIKVDDTNHKKVCVCGDEIVEAHSWDKGVVTLEPTCTENGVLTYTCELCKATKTEVIEATGHHYGDWIYSDKDNHKKVCDCGDEITEPHSWDEGAVITKQTCTEDGEMVYSCSVCNETKIEVVPHSGHNMTKHEAVLPTENSDGFKEYYTCANESGIYFKDEKGLQKFDSYDEIVERVPGKRPSVFVGYDYDSKPVKSVSLMNKYVKAYYDAKTDDEEYELVHFIKSDDTIASFTVDNPENGTQNLGLKWKDDGSEEYSIYFATNRLFTNYSVMHTARNYLNDGVLIPGNTYYYCVYGEKANYALDFGKIEVESEGARFVYVPADRVVKENDKYVVVPDDKYTCGFRDIGGWNSTYGVKTPYGRIYRGAQLHGALDRGGSSITEEGKRIASEELGIKTEIDLRGYSESDQTASYIPGANYVVAGIDQYASFFKPGSKAHIETILRTLGQEENYPVYFHCAAGADRTGTISFMLNSLLGVNESDCIKDYEMKSFAASGSFRYRDYHTKGNPSGGLDGTFEELDSIYAILDKFHTLYPGVNSLPELMYKVLTEYIGVDSSLIDNFINLNLNLSVNREAVSKTVSFLNCDVSPIEVKHGSSLGSLRAPSMEGYVFDHFEYENGEVYNPLAPVTEDISLVARWNKVGGDTENINLSTWNVRDIKATHQFVDENENAKVEKEDKVWSGKTLLYTRSQVKNDYYAELPKLAYKNSGKISFEIISHWETHNISIDGVSLGSIAHNKTMNIEIIDGTIYVDYSKKGAVSYDAMFGFAAPKLVVTTNKTSKSGYIEVTPVKASIIDYKSKIVEISTELNKITSLNDVNSDSLKLYKEYLKLKDSFTPYEKETFIDLLTNEAKTALSTLVKEIKLNDWGVNTGTYFVEAGQSLDINNPIKHGDYDFAYWGDAAGNKVNLSSPISKDGEYYAYYLYDSVLTGDLALAKKIYNVSYDSYPEKNTHYGDNENPVAADNTFPRSDYTFKYWSTNEHDTTARLDESKPLTSDVTLFAVWENNETHQLEILEHGGINIETKVTFVGVGEFNYIYGQKAESKAAPVHSKGYDFAYWALNDEPFDFNTPITESITLEPKYYGLSDEITDNSFVVCQAKSQLSYCSSATKADARNTAGVSYVISASDATHGTAIQYAGRKAETNTYYYTLPVFKFNDYPLVTFEIKNSWRVGSYYLEDGTAIKENVSTSTFFTVSIKNGDVYVGETLVKNGLDEDILNGTKSLVIKFVYAASGSNDETLVYDYKAYKQVVGLDD